MFRITQIDSVSCEATFHLFEIKQELFYWVQVCSSVLLHLSRFRNCFFSYKISRPSLEALLKATVLKCEREVWYELYIRTEASSGEERDVFSSWPSAGRSALLSVLTFWEHGANVYASPGSEP